MWNTSQNVEPEGVCLKVPTITRIAQYDRCKLCNENIRKRLGKVENNYGELHWKEQILQHKADLHIQPFKSGKNKNSVRVCI